MYNKKLSAAKTDNVDLTGWNAYLHP